MGFSHTLMFQPLNEFGVSLLCDIELNVVARGDRVFARSMIHMQRHFLPIGDFNDVADSL